MITAKVSELFVLMRQAMDGLTNPSIAKHLCRPSPDGLGLTFWKKKNFFSSLLVFGPSLPVSGTLFDRHCPAGWKIFDPSSKSQINDDYFFSTKWNLRCGNSLNKTEHLKKTQKQAPVTARWRPYCSLTSSRTKVVRTEQLTFSSAAPWEFSKG